MQIRNLLACMLGLTLMGCQQIGASCEVPAIEQATENLGPIEQYSLAELSEGMADKRFSSEAITAAYLQRIAEIDDAGPELNAVLALMPDALAIAKQRDQQRCDGEVLGPLHGIPVLIKDNIEAAGPVPTTAGSTALLENVTGRDAPLVARLKEAGAIILGKTNLSQWANFRSDDSTSGWSSVGGLVKNPHRLAYNSCGSSSGSGAAMAAGLAAGTIGTETDGSIMCPSSANGIVGLKPTVGLVSRRYIIPISETQDTAGPMTRSVTDAAIMLTAMAGTDPQDKATAEADERRRDYAADLSVQGLEGVRIGVMRDQLGENPAIIEQFEKALSQMREAGAMIVDIPERGIDEETLGDAEFKILLVEFKAGLNAYLASTPESVKVRTLADLIQFNAANKDIELAHFGQELFEMAEEQAGLDDPEYRAALQATRRIAGTEGIDRLLRENEVDVLVSPTLGPAWRSTLGQGDKFEGPSASWLPATSGYPHLTVPMGAVDNLPIGISFYGPKWSDHALLKVGYAYEQNSKARRDPKFLED